ncbi:MAG TPA: hypothetical protein VF301_00090 [Ginsengibacter sp.]
MTLKKCFTAFVLFVLFHAVSFAQEATSEIVGVVTNASGNPVIGA